MEARGIEPRSENDSDAATTCVDEAYSVSPPRRLAGHGSDEPLETLTRPVRAPGHASPILRYVSAARSEEHTSELQSRLHLVCRLLLEKKKKNTHHAYIQVTRISTA